jgi:putative spermidine/putrescine transport system substrate-binding protein
VVPAACQGNDLLGAEGCTTNGYDYFDQIAFWKTPVADCGDGSKDCVPYDKWTNAYIAVMGSK